MGALKIDTDGHIVFDLDEDDIDDFRFTWAAEFEGEAISSSIFIHEASAVTIGDGSNGAPAPSFTNKSDHAARVDSTYYKQGAGIVLVADNGYSYECVQAGFTGVLASVTFPTIEGQKVIDGDCIFKCWRNFCYTTVWVVGSTSATGIVTNRAWAGSRRKDKSMRINITPSKGA